MIRKLTRERREYLYRKSALEKNKVEFEKKKRIREALEEEKSIPTELRNEAQQLSGIIDSEDARTKNPENTIDDEYANAPLTEPKIFITTSRDPSSRLMIFAKELKLLFPNAQRINRGNHVVQELVSACRANGVTDMVVVHEHRGEPDGMVISHMPYGPTIYFGLSDCVLRHDVDSKKTMSLAYPHLIFHNFNSKLGERVQKILKHLFPPAKEDTKRVITFANDSDYISFRHHTYEKKGKHVELAEIGPRFEMKLFQIKLGTIEMEDADTEWALRPYMNSAKNRRFL
eukprot:TRINITY_DN917_c3_g1_i1.p1 TRINITY_DN917_c3_g1~~TRINITY_DN917_c3_g1_i1.p1  ORF type:complete len:287 (+),score=114.44 TRINITY_DN917_c3_g1_i1:129-989(+)